MCTAKEGDFYTEASIDPLAEGNQEKREVRFISGAVS